MNRSQDELATELRLELRPLTLNPARVILPLLPSPLQVKSQNWTEKSFYLIPYEARQHVKCYKIELKMKWWENALEK